MFFAAEYERTLNELNFNSKPLINNLTTLAKDNQHLVSQIVRLIENRVRNVI